MQIFKRLNCLLFLIIISFSCLSASILELPIKNINGKNYYYYKVQPKETIYSITHKLKIDKDEIFKYNPSVADGLRVHDVLYFPVSMFNDEELSAKNVEYTNHRIKKGETLYGICKQYNITKETLFAHNPHARDGIKNGDSLKIPHQKSNILEQKEEINTSNEENIKSNDFLSTSDSTTFINNTEIIESSNNGKVINIAIMLPFMLEENTPSKQALLYTEFYKGFLIALNEHKNNQTPINIYTYDTGDSLDLVKSILNKPELKDIDIIIAPNNDQQLKLISNFAMDHNCYVLNIFDVKNTLHETHFNILQANIPQDIMYDKTIKYFIETYNNHTPIFLHNKERRSDKAAFISKLKAQLDSSHISHIEIPFTSTLIDKDLSKLNDSTKYVFIPMSGNRSELASVMTAITNLRDSVNSPENITLFGYPEWTTFTGTTKERMINLNATIYSRFYEDVNNSQSKNLHHDYNKWYNDEMIDAIPSQGTLGYDTGKYIFQSINQNNGIFDVKFSHKGIQHGYNFIKASDNAGYINNTLYIIKFHSNGTIDKILLD